MKVLELKGTKSMRAFNAFQTLLLGLKMLPAYMGETYEDFYARIELLEPEAQEKIIREAAFFVELQKDELEAVMSFCCDANGVPYSSENIKNLSPSDFIDGIVAVSMEFAKMRIGLVSENQKKKIRNFSIDLKPAFAKNPGLPFEEIANLAFYEACHV
jgi:hypothetical protein